MIEKIFKIYQEYGLEILAGLSILIILILFLYNYFSGREGTYTDKFRNTSLLKNSNSIEGGIEHTLNDSKMELQCKYILENLFQKPFLKIRPNFLKNDITGENLELDLYNDELKLAVEVNGQQHYKFTPFFQKSHEAFRNQQYRDYMKREKCKNYGIVLIEIPYNVPVKKLRGYIMQKLRLHNYLL